MKDDFKREILDIKKDRPSRWPSFTTWLCRLSCGHVRSVHKNQKLFAVGKRVICRDCQQSGPCKPFGVRPDEAA
jgi:hypothetical protein